MTRVAIVGAGVVGATIAYELSFLPGLTVDLFDAQEPGQGSTGAALGILMAVISQKTRGRGWRLREQSLRRYRTLLPELEKVLSQPMEANRQGLIKLLWQEDGPRWQKLQATRQEQGYPLALWSREQTQVELKGWDLPYDQLQGAVYSPWDWQIQPQPLTRALVAAAQRRGVPCHCHCPVTINPGAPRVKEIETPQGNFPVDYVIVAAGLGSNGLLQGKDLTNAPPTLEAVIGQAFLLQLPALPQTQRRSPLTSEDIHFVPIGNNQYWLGATLEFPPDCPMGQPNDRRRQELWQRALAYYPFLQQAKIINYWSGKRPRPVGESAPVIRPWGGGENVLITTGHYRNGVLLAPATAQRVKEWLAGP